MIEKQQLQVDCPICNQSHKYDLIVKRITSIGMNHKPHADSYSDKEITRLFTCPLKGKNFQATFNLRESIDDLISGVELEPKKQ